jgi:hypothetical protein
LVDDVEPFELKLKERPKKRSKRKKLREKEREREYEKDRTNNVQGREKLSSFLSCTFKEVNVDLSKKQKRRLN